MIETHNFHSGCCNLWTTLHSNDFKLSYHSAKYLFIAKIGKCRISNFEGHNKRATTFIAKSQHMQIVSVFRLNSKKRQLRNELRIEENDEFCEVRNNLH